MLLANYNWECRRCHSVGAGSTHLIALIPALGGGLLALGGAMELLQRHRVVHHLLLLGGAALIRRCLQVRIIIGYRIGSESVCFVNFFTHVFEAPNLGKDYYGV